LGLDRQEAVSDQRRFDHCHNLAYGAAGVGRKKKQNGAYG
jgi:hypothetical protein